MPFDASQAAQELMVPDSPRSKSNDSLRRCLAQQFDEQGIAGTEGQASLDISRTW